jgi:hypothetical protein
VLVSIVAATASAAEPITEPQAARLQQLAQIFDVQPLIERLEEAPAGSSVEAQLLRVRLREDALSQLDRTSLMIAATLARIEREQFATVNARSTLDTRHTRSVLTWSLAATLTGSITSIVGTSLQFEGTTESKIGNGISIGGAALSATLLIVALTRKDRGRPPFVIPTNFLAQLLGRAPTPASTLPEPIWRYLDAPLAGAPSSIRSQLLAAWVKQGSISLPPSATARDTLDLLTSPISMQQTVAAAVLTSRANMLADLRASIGEMTVDLQGLVRQVRSHEP